MTNSKFLGLRTTIYLVDDVAAAKRWYSQVFGVEPYFDEPFYIGFNIGGYELGLQPQQNTGVKVPTVLSYWGVEDIHTAFDSLIAAGARAHEEPTNVGGELMVATVFDPWDNLIGIIYNPYFSIPD